MSNNLDKFEKALFDSLESHEVPYNKQHWEEMSGRLDQLPKTGGGSITNWIVAASIGVALITTGIILYNMSWNDKADETAEVQNTEQAEGNTNSSNTSANNTTNENTQNENTTNASYESGTVDSDQHAENEENESAVSSTSTESLNNTTTNNTSEESTDETTNNSNETPQTLVIVANFKADKNVVCEGETIRFKPEVINDQTSYLWKFGDGTTSTKVNPTHTYNAGTYTAKLEVTNVATGKTATESFGPIVVNELPELAFRYTINETTLEPTYQFENQSNTNDVFWTFGDGHTSNEANPTHDFARKGLYDVTIASTNLQGCSAELTQRIPVDRLFNLFVENTFSPNGDGHNETFIPKGLELLDVTFNMSIYNAEGELIYETENYNNPWDGRMSDGKLIPDTYVWIVVMNTPDGEEDIHRGTITVIL